MSSKKIIIGYGLPGSGKSTLLNKINRDTKESNILNIDHCSNGAKYRRKTVEACIKEDLYAYNSDQVVILDGLFTTNDDLIKLINIVKSAYIGQNLKFTIQYFNEDRPACLWNDEYRRTENSEITIKTMRYEKPNKDYIFENTGYKVSLVLNTVQRKPKYQYDANALGYQLENGHLISESWTTGGTYCDCWGGEFEVDAESPVEFKQLDEILLKIKPDITYLQYKKLFSECVDTDYYYESDYYGGGVSYEYYKCDLEKLYKIIDEL